MLYTANESCNPLSHRVIPYFVIPRKIIEEIKSMKVMKAILTAAVLGMVLVLAGVLMTVQHIDGSKVIMSAGVMIELLAAGRLVFLHRKSLEA